MSRSPNFYAASYLLLMKDGKILLQKRTNTGWMDGFWNLPAGHLEGTETVVEGLKREAKEEIGITLRDNEVSLKHVMHRISTDDRVYVDFFFTAEKWEGEIQNSESHKHEAVEWFSLENLPSNIVPYIRNVIERIENNISFSEDVS
jgi:8-oxo-dGTP diphosphatase